MLQKIALLLWFCREVKASTRSSIFKTGSLLTEEDGRDVYIKTTLRWALHTTKVDKYVIQSYQRELMMYCMFLVSLTIGITLNMSCTIVLPYSIFDSVLWDDNLLQSVPLLPHQDSEVNTISWMANPCFQGPLLFNGECQRCKWFLELHRKWPAWRALFWGVVQPRYTLSTKVIDKAWAVYMYDVWKIKTSMPEKDFLRSNNPSCEW